MAKIESYWIATSVLRMLWVCTMMFIEMCEHALVQSNDPKKETQVIFLNVLRLWFQFTKFLGSKSLFYCIYLYISIYSNIIRLIIVIVCIDHVKLGWWVSFCLCCWSWKGPVGFLIWPMKIYLLLLGGSLLGKSFTEYVKNFGILMYQLILRVIEESVI